MKNFKYCCLLFLLLLSGCGGNKSQKSGPAYSYLNKTKKLSDVGRVVLVELDNYSAYPKVASDFTDALYEAVQKKQIFGLTLVRKDEPIWRNLRLDNVSNFSLDQLSAIHKSLKADAILRGTVTRYEPYPHLILGLRLELIDLKDGQLLWALEQIWDADDKNTQERVKDFYDKSIIPFSDGLEKGLGVVSSLKFFKFVAYETAETLQQKK